LDQVRKALGDRGYITGQTIAAQTKNLKGDISLAALDAPVIASLQATDPGKSFLTPSHSSTGSF
jgi:hypothetical protein